MTSARRRMLHVGTGIAVALTLAACQGTGSSTPTDSPPTPAPTDEISAPEELETPVTDPASEAPDPDTDPDADPAPADDGIPEDAAVNGPNSIVEPLDGASVSGPAVTVRGEGTAYEGTLNYEVVRVETDEVVAADFTQAGANGEVGPYEFTVDLDPGTYVVRVFEPEISDSEPGDTGPYVNLVEVTITVT